ncbi:MAG: OadG family transporter subunit [Micropruina glycogenica]|jgi:Na+-transporting methylmalonyl-CoA/oxaloacetate decarboxylase gamma subunit|nr:OadG family protein [Propionibacteriaceae bacterium]
MWTDLAWGLQMMLVGMGAVFALLLLLMVVLRLTARLDRTDRDAEADQPGGEPTAAPMTVQTGPDGSTRILVDDTGLDVDTVAAIAVAVMTHAEHRRRLAGPEVRAHAPGSQLFASRWVSVGRTQQTQPFRKS